MEAKSVMRVTKLIGLLAAAGATLMLAACATGPVIRTRMAMGANLASAQTFAFVAHPGTDHGPYKSLTTQLLERDVTGEMESRGYTRVSRSADPDLLVDFRVRVHSRVVSSYPAGPYWGGGWGGPWGGWGWGDDDGPWGWGGPWGGWGWGGGFYNDVYTVTKSALTISVIDRADRSVVWSGTAIATLSHGMMSHPGRSVERSVQEIFAHYPVLRR
jgi:hypothetical protein